MDIEFNGGDEIRQPFRIMVGSDVANLSGCSVSALLIANSNTVLSSNNGLTISADQPTGDDPHGFFTINENLTQTLPNGRIARVRLIVVDPAGITSSTVDTFLKRIG